MDEAERTTSRDPDATTGDSAGPPLWPRAMPTTSVHALTERIRELEDAVRCRDEFLAILAHELRNPLAPIRNVAQILQTLSHADPTLTTAGQILARQTAHMSRLVDDLFDTARSSWGRLALDMKLVDAGAILAAALETVRPRLTAALDRVTIELPQEPLLVRADETRLAQIFCNLLDNAVKYTPEGGRIEVEARAESGDAVIRIRDTGFGIPEEMLSSIFELFTQVRPERDRSRGGLGLGLPLVKRLVEMHGGSVEAKSDGPDRGSEFVVRLQLAVAALPAVQMISPRRAGRTSSGRFASTPVRGASGVQRGDGASMTGGESMGD